MRVLFITILCVIQARNCLCDDSVSKSMSNHHKIGTHCVYDNDCPQHGSCSEEHKCRCAESHQASADNSICQATFGAECHDDNCCATMTNARCNDKRCTCKEGYAVISANMSRCERSFPCENDNYCQRTINNSVCINKVCICKNNGSIDDDKNMICMDGKAKGKASSLELSVIWLVYGLIAKLLLLRL